MRVYFHIIRINVNILFILREESQSKFSRLKGNCGFYLSVPYEDTSEIRKQGNPYIPLQGVNQEGVSKSHFCFAFLPDDKMEVWVRELSCIGCDHCSSPTFLSDSGRLQCDNSDICGSWKRYPIMKEGEKDPRKEGKNGSYDGKRMFVSFNHHLL